MGYFELKSHGGGGVSHPPPPPPSPTWQIGLKAINTEITRIRGNSDITILPNVNTLQCILIAVGAKVKVSFDVPNSLASVLGLMQDIVYVVGRHASEKIC